MEKDLHEGLILLEHCEDLTEEEIAIVTKHTVSINTDMEEDSDYNFLDEDKEIICVISVDPEDEDNVTLVSLDIDQSEEVD